MLTVSVVITNYNYSRYIAQAIDSVLAQSRQAKEIIVVDDGSTDNSRQVLERFIRHPLVRLIFQENQGQARAKNRGSRAATGDLVAFLDGDDLWYEDKLARQVPLLEQDDSVGVVCSGFDQIDPNGNPLEKGFRPYRLHRGTVTEALLFENFVCFSSAIIRKSLLDALEHQDETIEIGTDWDLFLRASVKAGFDFISEPLVAYRVGNSGKLSDKREKRFYCADQIKEKFFAQNPAFQHLAKKRWHQSYLNRAVYYVGRDKAKSQQLFKKAIALMPFDIKGYWRYLKAQIKHRIQSSS